MSSILPPKLLEEFEEVAKKLKLNKSQKEKALKYLEKKYLEALIDPQEPIGVVTAQSFGEPSLQMLLNAFHFAGVAEVQLMTGLPRIIEILDAKRKPKVPSMTIYLKKEYQTPEKAEEVAKKIKEVKLKDIAKRIDIDLIENSIIVELDEEAMKEYNIDIKELKKKAKVGRSTVKIEGNVIYVKFNNPKRPKELYQYKNKLKEVVVSGIKGITYTLVTRDKQTGELIIQTFGSNLKEVLELEEIDETRTITNDIHEIAKVLGIDAAREAIIREIQKVLEEQGLEIDYRYLALVADMMTWYGEVLGFTRYGLMDKKKSPLQRAVFETPVQIFIKAALYGEPATMESVIENILVNQPVPIGTGRLRVVFDEEKFLKEYKKLKEKAKQ